MVAWSGCSAVPTRGSMITSLTPFLGAHTIAPRPGKGNDHGQAPKATSRDTPAPKIPPHRKDDRPRGLRTVAQGKACGAPGGSDSHAACRRRRPVRGSETQRRQLRAADPGVIPAANGRDPSRPHCRHSRSATLLLSAVARAGAEAGFGAGTEGHSRRRHGLGHAAQRSGHGGGASRRTDARRGAQYHQHAARRRDRRLHPCPRRSQGADHRPRVRPPNRPSARECTRQSGPALAQLKSRPLVIDVDDPLYSGPGPRLGEVDYEELIASGSPDFPWMPPDDESSAIALNYTSGTTGNPKGVVYHHRGTFLEAVGNIMAWPLPPVPVYLWTLPMFHCNGWCFPWSVIAMGGTHVCLRKVDPALIFPMIVEHGVTHMCGAPTVLNMLIDAPAEQRRAFDHIVDIQTGGSPPPTQVSKGQG